MIEWTGLDQMLDYPIQKYVVLLLLPSLLELSLACLRTLASLLCCSCSVNVGAFLVTSPACCVVQLGSVVGRFCLVMFLFVSVIVVSLDSLL